jgi:glycosyltransferase involved in cell wall biosynthesis
MKHNFTQKVYRRLLLIGPKPPPEHGTSVKFATFLHFVQQRLGMNEIDVVDTQTGDKALVPVFGWSSLQGYIRILFQSVIKGWHANIIVVFGSQRFASVFGSLITVIFGLMGKQIYVSLFGGAFDIYLSELPGMMRFVVRKLLGTCNGIIVETRQLRNALVNIWPDKLYYVPNFRLPFNTTCVQQTCNNYMVRFIYVGVIRREKGIGELLEAFGKLEKHMHNEGLQPRVRLDLYGPLYNGPRDQVDLDSRHGSTNIYFHGEVSYEQVQNAYANADIFVFPSYWPSEGHSGAVLEALMHGLPVIAADWRAIPELVHDNENGLLCPPRVASALQACMERLVYDDTLRCKLAEGAKRSSAEFEAETVCLNMLKILLGNSGH